MRSDKAAAGRPPLPQRQQRPQPSGLATDSGHEPAGHPQQPGHAERLQALGEVALDVAHDFRNLLTAMLNGCELLLDRHGPEDPLHDDLTQVLATAERARALAEEVLMFARGAPSEPVPLDVDHRLLALAPVLDQLVGTKVTLALALESDGAMVRIAPNRFDQAIFNLATNAGEAMAEGGRLVIRSSLTTVPPAGRWLQIDVTDSGPGIAPDVVDRIFEPFVTTKTASGGSGLGLAMVMRVATEAGGRVVVDSVPGQGATFSLVLPVSAIDRASTAAPDATPALVAPPPQPGQRPAEPAMVMLVEDEDAVRVLAARALAGRGHQVVEAGSAEEALAMLAERRLAVDLIVSDLMLPGMDGLAFAGEIRARLDGVPFLLVSGYAAGTAAGVRTPAGVRVLAKPYTLQGLVQAVEQALAAETGPGPAP